MDNPLQTFIVRYLDDGRLGFFGTAEGDLLGMSGATLAEDSLEDVSDHTPYNPEYHARNQQRHSSWVLQLNQKKLN